ncbi:MAG: CopD family protein [Gammaproteobacteria bacterium]|nr:CopD family protein [Gammaproteobacteria bacterium]MDH5778165.1 CopD family protein [Gammaproteobacteria bacterium]
MLYVKALHIAFMVTWFAGLFYLPRLYVYHAMSDDEISKERFKIMERKLYFGIMTPGAILTFIFGFWLLMDYAWAAYATTGWLITKFILIGILVIYHIHCGKLLMDFKHDRNTRSHVYYRWYNEFPVLILLAVVILAVVKPF